MQFSLLPLGRQLLLLVRLKTPRDDFPAFHVANDLKQATSLYGCQYHTIIIPIFLKIIDEIN